YQRERTRRQEMASHGCLLSSGLRERCPPFHALRKPPHTCSRGRRSAVGLRRQPPEARLGSCRARGAAVAAAALQYMAVAASLAGSGILAVNLDLTPRRSIARWNGASFSSER